MAGRSRVDPDDVAGFLPLTDLAFNVLVVLSGGRHHGYALLKELRTRSGRESLRTGTVYAALTRLERSGLVREVAPPEQAPAGDARRRFYDVTPLGLAVARAEADRLRAVLDEAGARGLLPHSR